MEQELKVLRGSILVANGDREYKSERSTLEIKAGDKIIVGYDGLLHPLKNSHAALNIDSDFLLLGWILVWI